MSSTPVEPPAPEAPEEEERSGSYLSGDASTDPVVVRTARNVRRVGYIIAVVGILATTVPILIGVFRGVIVQEVRDPYTGRAIPTRDTRRDQTDCAAWGMELVQLKSRAALPAADHQAWYDACGESSLWMPSPERELVNVRRILGVPTPPGP